MNDATIQPPPRRPMRVILPDREAVCVDCNQVIPPGTEFIWTRGEAFHVGRCPAWLHVVHGDGESSQPTLPWHLALVTRRA